MVMLLIRVSQRCNITNMFCWYGVDTECRRPVCVKCRCADVGECDFIQSLRTQQTVLYCDVITPFGLSARFSINTVSVKEIRWTFFCPRPAMCDVTSRKSVLWRRCTTAHAHSPTSVCVCEMELQRPLSGVAQNSQQHRPVCWAVMMTDTVCHGRAALKTPIQLNLPITTYIHMYAYICMYYYRPSN